MLIEILNAIWHILSPVRDPNAQLCIPIIPIIMAGAAIYSGIKSAQAKKEQERLHNQPVPKFGATPETIDSMNRANGLAQGGFSPAERASFQQNIAQDINTQNQRALDVGGGNLAQTIAAQGKINTLGAEGKFASADAALHRQNIKYADTFSRQMQQLSNMNIGNQYKARIMAEQSLGLAANQQDQNMLNYAMMGAGSLGSGGGASHGGSAGMTGMNTGVASGGTDSGINYPSWYRYQNRNNYDSQGGGYG